MRKLENVVYLGKKSEFFVDVVNPKYQSHGNCEVWNLLHIDGGSQPKFVENSQGLNIDQMSLEGMIQENWWRKGNGCRD